MGSLWLIPVFSTTVYVWTQKEQNLSYVDIMLYDICTTSAGTPVILLMWTVWMSSGNCGTFTVSVSIVASSPFNKSRKDLR